MLSETVQASSIADDWLRRFHAGERALIRQLYIDYVATVTGAISGLVAGPDRETVIHEVFLAMLERPEMRESFRGGSIAAWLTTVARNRAIDLVRRHRREQTALDELGALGRRDRVEASDLAAAAQRRLAEFRATLPAAWCAVFDACFVEQRSPRDAARMLGVARTTLAYRELQIRRRLRRFVLEGPDV